MVGAVIKITEAATVVGLSKTTIRSLCKRDLIPYYCPPGTNEYCFIREELMDWLLKSKYRKPNQEPLAPGVRHRNPDYNV